MEAEVTRGDFERWIADDLAAIEATVDTALERAGIGDRDVDAIFLTGGTSFVPAVRDLFARRFPPERLHQGDAFQSVASGLAAAGGGPGRQPIAGISGRRTRGRRDALGISFAMQPSLS